MDALLEGIQKDLTDIRFDHPMIYGHNTIGKGDYARINAIIKPSHHMLSWSYLWNVPSEIPEDNNLIEKSSHPFLQVSSLRVFNFCSMHIGNDDIYSDLTPSSSNYDIHQFIYCIVPMDKLYYLSLKNTGEFVQKYVTADNLIRWRAIQLEGYDGLYIKDDLIEFYSRGALYRPCWLNRFLQEKSGFYWGKELICSPMFK